MMRHAGLYTLLAALVAATPLAAAQFPGRTPSIRTSPGMSSRTGISRQSPGSASARLSRPSGSYSGASSRSGQTGSRYNASSSLGDLLGSRSNNASGVLQELYNQYQDRRYTHEREKQEEEMAKAYRDAAIVNAVAGLVGTLATAAINADCRTAPPPPMQTVAPVQSGHYETRRVLIRAARQESYRVWDSAGVFAADRPADRRGLL